MRKSILVLLAAVSAQGFSQTVYEKSEVLIPMRDGVKLFTSIYTPKDSPKAAPFMLQRTPYSCAPYGPTRLKTAFGPDGTYGAEGYIFVTQDVRGRYMSEGEFKWMTPYLPKKKPGQTDESTDTYDTIEWLLKNVPKNNGRVGIYGTSFPGHYAAQALIDPHPALVAASPQAPMADNWLGDDMHHNGAFYLPHAMNFIAGFGKVRQGPTTNYGPRVFSHDTNDGYQFFLKMGPLKNALTQYNMNQIPLWKEWVSHPNYDEYWATQNVPQHLKKADKVAVLLVGGWFDAEDLQGPLAIHQAIERFTPRNNTSIVMGPWYHGSWNGGPGNSLYDIAWTTRTGEDFRNQLQRPFFRKYLWQDADATIPEAQVFDAGADVWRSFGQWPPKAAKRLSLYLEDDRTLSAGRRTLRPGFREYVSDPASPVPNSATTTVGMARSYMLEDQRFVASRPDVLTYESPVLGSDLTLAGPLKASLFVSTTGTDADFVVKLIDVFPNDYSVASPRGADVKMGGYQMMVRGEPMRARFRKSWSKPIPFVPGKVEKVEFSMPDVCHTFRKGHRFMVQIHSTWFPLMDRNPQTFVPNIFEASAEDFKAATHRVFSGGSTASRLQVTVLP